MTGNAVRRIDRIFSNPAVSRALGVVGVGAAIAGGVSIAAAYANKRLFSSNLYTKDLVFPTDLDKYSISMSFDFYEYSRRSIFKQPHQKSKGTIRLPIPKNIKDEFRVEWVDKEQGPFVGAAVEGILAAGQDIGRGLSQGGAEGLATAFISAAQAGGGIAAGAGISVLEEQIPNITSAIGGRVGMGDRGKIELQDVLQPLGLAVNPFLTVMFKKPNFKEFQMNWRLAARTPQESGTINSIINMFKYHMLPGIPTASGGNIPIGSGGTLLQYPDTVQIGFYSSDNYLYRFKPCVIKNISVNYAPNSTPSFFKGNQNVPTEIDVSLSFYEIEYWTKNDFDPVSKGSNPFDNITTGGYIPGVS